MEIWKRFTYLKKKAKQTEKKTPKKISSWKIGEGTLVHIEIGR